MEKTPDILLGVARGKIDPRRYTHLILPEPGKGLGCYEDNPQ